MAIMKSYRIALIPGDGIGREVVPAAAKVLRAAAREFTLDFREFEWGCEYYLRAGHMMPEDGLDQLRPQSAVYNISRAVHLRGPLRVEALKQTLDVIVARHEVLRTTFATVNGVPV